MKSLLLLLVLTAGFVTLSGCRAEIDPVDRPLIDLD